MRRVKGAVKAAVRKNKFHNCQAVRVNRIRIGARRSKQFHRTQYTYLVNLMKAPKAHGLTQETGFCLPHQWRASFCPIGADKCIEEDWDEDKKATYKHSEQSYLKNVKIISKLARLRMEKRKVEAERNSQVRRKRAVEESAATSNLCSTKVGENVNLAIILTYLD